jgi:hypothetical protein
VRLQHPVKFRGSNPCPHNETDSPAEIEFRTLLFSVPKYFAQPGPSLLVRRTDLSPFEQSPMRQFTRADGVPKRIRIQDGHLFVCQACCCGLGPCALANIVLIQFHGQTVWLHSINSTDDVNSIYDYVEEMLLAEEYLDLPTALAGRQFQRYGFESIQQNKCAIGDRS